MRDIPAELGSYDGHALIASRTGSGKTTSIQSAIQSAIASQPSAEFHIFDPKGAAWCGLEKRSDYLLCNRANLLGIVVDRLEAVLRTLESRQSQRVSQGGHWHRRPTPIYVILDEFNTLLALAKEYDQGFPPKENPKTEQRLKQIVTRIICQGREDRVVLWLMSQTTRVEQMGLDTSLQQNMAYLAQARGGDFQSVRDAVRNSYVVTDPAQRKNLNALIDWYENSSEDKSIPICFSTLGGINIWKLPSMAQVALPQAQPKPLLQPAKDISWKLLEYLQKKQSQGQLPIDSRTLASNLNKKFDCNTDDIKLGLQQLIQTEKIICQKKNSQLVVNQVLV